MHASTRIARKICSLYFLLLFLWFCCVKEATALQKRTCIALAICGINDRDYVTKDWQNQRKSTYKWAFPVDLYSNTAETLWGRQSYQKSSHLKHKDVLFNLSCIGVSMVHVCVRGKTHITDILAVVFGLCKFFPALEMVPSGYSGFLQRSKDMHDRLI